MYSRFLNMSSLQDLQKMQERFAKLLNLSLVVTDAVGNLHTEPSSPYCDIFSKSTKSKECARCIWCAEDDRLTPHMYVPQSCCPLGFEDFEIPITVDEKEIGYVVFGQVYKSLPSDQVNRDPELQNVLARIPVYSERERNILLEVGSSITKLITQVSFARARDVENHKLDIVRDIMFQLSKAPDLQSILQSLNIQLPRLIEFDLLGVYFYDPEANKLNRKFAEGFASESLGEDFKEGEGYAGTVAREKKKYLIIDDAPMSDVKIKYQALVDKGLNSFLIVALSFDKEFIGVIILARKVKSGFKEDAAKLVAFLAENISSTVWKTRINSLLNRKIEEMGTIIDFSLQPDIESLLSFVVKRIPSLFDAKSCSIFLRRTKSGDFQCKRTFGIYETTTPELLIYPANNKSLVGYVGTTGEYLILEDANNIEYLRSLGLESLELTDELREIPLPALIVPIMDKVRDVKGVIRLLGKQNDGFTEEDRQILETFAERIDLYLTTADIKDQQNKLIRELERLHEIQAELHIGLDEDKELFLILTALTIKGGLSFNRAILFLRRTENGKDVVRGRMAIGPKDQVDSTRIYEDSLWNEDKSFRDFLKVAENEFDRDRGTILFSQLNRFTRELVFGLDENNVLTDAIKSGDGLKTFDSQLCDLSSDSFYRSFHLEEMEASEFIIAPLIYHGMTLGAIYVDNIFNNKSISTEEQYLLNIYMNQAGAVLHKALLLRNRQSSLIALTYHTLQTKLDLLKQNKELMVKDLGDSQTNARFERHSSKFDAVMRDMNESYAEIRDYHQFALNKTSGYMQSLLPKADSIADVIDSSRVRIEIIGDGRAPFICDFGSLRKSLEELIRNSCKHSAKQGELKICLQISLREKEDQRGTVLTIDYSDNGIGIPDSSREKIFEPFFTTGQKSKCSGIGLADVKQKVEAHCGWIRLARKDELINNCGVRFLIEIPVSIRRVR